MIPIGAYATLGDTLLTAARRAPRQCERATGGAGEC